jgi:hypothetical protein
MTGSTCCWLFFVILDGHKGWGCTWCSVDEFLSFILWTWDLILINVQCMCIAIVWKYTTTQIISWSENFSTEPHMCINRLKMYIGHGYAARVHGCTFQSVLIPKWPFKNWQLYHVQNLKPKPQLNIGHCFYFYFYFLNYLLCQNDNHFTVELWY